MINKISLIIPDLHHRWKQAEAIINHVGPDETIFLGDYFDDFNDTPAMVTATSKWLLQSVNTPNRIHLFGNHDQAYAYPMYKSFLCSGWTPLKSMIVNEVISGDTWDKIKWYHFLDDVWFLSHAGIHRNNIPETLTETSGITRTEYNSKIKKFLDEELINGFKLAKQNQSHWIFGAGRSRGGGHRVGGITWCDYDREFFPIKGLNQIVGHTPQISRHPIWTLATPEDSGYVRKSFSEIIATRPLLEDLKSTLNLGLDVLENTYYAVWNGEKLTIGNYKDL